ncbi:unnamed protein product [Oppiella nova]|uniref:Uncharacterized protein n=1 Tax=Oppiella nova TaxID=334625 RepID=A0A7R9M5I2_9ACAR|nr:unnamed protein product [Oppiella nova]CAG2170625.1 unnamed protein product [Oppiella nova]
MFVSSDRKSEFKTESIARKVDDLSDRIELKSAHIEIKFESTLNKIVDKLDSIERHIDRTGEEVFEKFSKYDERHTVFESHVKSHIINIESLVKHSLDANTKIKDIVTYDFQSVDNMVQTLKDYKQDHNSVISILSTVAIQLQNYTTLHTLQDTGFRDNNHKKCDNCGTNSANSPTNGRSLDDNTTAGTDGNDIREVSSTVEQLRQQLAVDEKLTQLDVHVDYYSRKIINTIQEIWRSSQTSEEYLKVAIDTANKTRSLIRQELHRLQELIDGSLTKTPDFSDIREPLEQKLYHLSTTIDDSFNALMISQNSFISSCNRIQEEEEQLYDVLDDMLVEIRNKSSVDMTAVKESIDGLRSLINESTARLQTQIERTDERIVTEIMRQIHSNSSATVAHEECFLTRSQLISVCRRDRHNSTKNSDTNDEQTDEELPPNRR